MMTCRRQVTSKPAQAEESLRLSKGSFTSQKAADSPAPVFHSVTEGPGNNMKLARSCHAEVVLMWMAWVMPGSCPKRRGVAHAVMHGH